MEAESGIEEIEYVEKSRRYYCRDIGPAAESCITQVLLRAFFMAIESWQSVDSPMPCGPARGRVTDRPVKPLKAGHSSLGKVSARSKLPGMTF